MRPQDQNPYDDIAYDVSEMLEVDYREHYVRALHYFDIMIYAETSIVDLKRLVEPGSDEDVEFFTKIFNDAEDKIIELYDEMAGAYLQYDLLPPFNYDEFTNYLEGMTYGYFNRRSS
jgi:transcription elongation factor GreA-like protein